MIYIYTYICHPHSNALTTRVGLKRSADFYIYIYIYMHTYKIYIYHPQYSILTPMP